MSAYKSVLLVDETVSSPALRQPKYASNTADHSMRSLYELVITGWKALSMLKVIGRACLGGDEDASTDLIANWIRADCKGGG